MPKKSKSFNGEYAVTIHTNAEDVRPPRLVVRPITRVGYSVSFEMPADEDARAKLALIELVPDLDSAIRAASIAASAVRAVAHYLPNYTTESAELRASLQDIRVLVSNKGEQYAKGSG